LGINNNNKGTIMSETGMIWIGGAIFAGILFFGGIQVGRGLSSGDGSLDMGEFEFRKHQARTIQKESIDILRRAEARDEARAERHNEITDDDRKALVSIIEGGLK